MKIIERWLNPFADPFSLIKLSLEASILVLFVALFIFFFFRIRRRNPVFMGKGYHELVAFMVVGIILYVIEVFDNWVWFTTEFYRVVWKPIKMSLSLIAMILLLLGFRRFYRFSDILFAHTG